MLSAGSLILIGMVAIFFVDDIIKKIMGATFITDGVNLFLIALGYREGGVVPILPEKAGNLLCSYPKISTSCIESFAEHASYPLPYALVLTNIVIGAATTAVLLGLVIMLYKKHRTLSTSKLLGVRK